MPAAPIEIDYDALLALPEAEQREEYAKIARLKRELESNPMWGYLPHDGGGTGGQIAYHQCSSEGIFIAAAIAGNRWGKTEAGMRDNLVQTLPPELVPPWLEQYRRNPYNGDYRCRIVVVDLPNALTKVWLPKMRRAIPADALWKGDFQKAWNERTRMLQFADGSWWDFLTHDMDVDAYAGADVDRIHFDEEPPGAKGRAQFDESLVRLIDREGDVRFTLTPLLGLNWVYYEVTEDGRPREDEECRVITGEMDHNPHISAKMRDRLKARWAKKDPLTLAARTKGSFVHFAGSIYPEFSEAVHAVPDKEIPRKSAQSKPLYPIYAAIDPGIDHPTGVVFAWLSPDDTMEVFRSFKLQGTVADVAKLYHETCRELNFRPRWTVIDPSARNKNHATGRSLQFEYSEHGIHTLPGQNARLAGYNRVKERLSSERLLIHASNVELIEEFRDYRWKTQKGQVEGASSQEPIKLKDDILDALRYLIMSLPVKGQDKEEERQLSEAERSLKHDLHKALRRRRARIGSIGR